jgi:leucine-rich PPR motif-containing protein
MSLCGRNHQGVSLALRLLDSAEQLQSTSKLQPDARIYATILKGLSQHRCSPSTAEDVFTRLKRQRFGPPSVAAYNALIGTWSKSRDPEASRRAKELLDELWGLYDNSSKGSASKYLPSSRTYHAVMSAIANGGRGRQVAEHVESLLDEMITLSKQHGDLTPTVYCFNVALNAWSKSGSAEAVDRCEALLERMRGLKLSPNVFNYTALIDAIARSGQEPERVDAILNRMAKEGVDPNVVTYSAVINGRFVSLFSHA